jgi:Zn-dependent protease
MNFKLGKILGIDIYINYSWIIIFLLVMWTFYSYLVTQSIVSTTGLKLAASFIYSLIFFASLLLHELSHSYVAKKNNIEIKNITLFLFGGVANIEREPDNPKVELSMAIAGPLMSVILGFIYLGISYLIPQKIFNLTFFNLGIINIFLAVFNLIPGFPLDGGRVLRAIIWLHSKNIKKATIVASRVGVAFGLFLIFSGLFIMFTTQDIISGLWLALVIGPLLIQLAAMSEYRIKEEGSWLDAPVSKICSTTLKTIPGDATLEEAINEYFSKDLHVIYPVLSNDGEINHYISLDDIIKIDRDKWATLRVKDVAKQITPDITIYSDEPIRNLQSIFRESGIKRVFVKKRFEEKIIGIVVDYDLERYLRIQLNIYEGRRNNK